MIVYWHVSSTKKYSSTGVLFSLLLVHPSARLVSCCSLVVAVDHLIVAASSPPGQTPVVSVTLSLHVAIDYCQSEGLDFQPEEKETVTTIEKVHMEFITAGCYICIFKTDVFLPHTHTRTHACTHTHTPWLVSQHVVTLSHSELWQPLHSPSVPVPPHVVSSPGAPPSGYIADSLTLLAPVLSQLFPSLS